MKNGVNFQLQNMQNQGNGGTVTQVDYKHSMSSENMQMGAIQRKEEHKKSNQKNGERGSQNISKKKSSKPKSMWK